MKSALLLGTCLPTSSSANQTIHPTSLSQALCSYFLFWKKNTDHNTHRPSQCIAFFSDSDPCNDGTTFGGPYCDGSFCNEDITILGHPNITFTGCKAHKNLVTEEIPSGVSDNGTPALKCKQASNPPGSLYGVYAVCNGGTSSKNGGYVNVDSYCS